MTIPPIPPYAAAVATTLAAAFSYAGAAGVASAALTPREAFFSSRLTADVDAAIGRLSAELVCPYPPGIPVSAHAARSRTRPSACDLSVWACGRRVGRCWCRAK